MNTTSAYPCSLAYFLTPNPWLVLSDPPLKDPSKRGKKYQNCNILGQDLRAKDELVYGIFYIKVYIYQDHRQFLFMRATFIEILVKRTEQN